MGKPRLPASKVSPAIRDARLEAALTAHIDALSPNLIRAYILDMVKDAETTELQKFVVAFKAQNAVRRGR